MSTVKVRKEKIVLLSLFSVTTILAFLAGYGFQRFIQQRTKFENIKIHQRSVRIEKHHKQKDRTHFDKRNFESSDRTPADVQHEDDEYHDDGVRSINASYIEEMLKFFTKEPHMGGTETNRKLGEFIETEWKKHGFDRVELKDYDVLLSYPRQPANISMMDNKGKILFKAKTIEDAYFGSENSTKSVYPFNAFSASGTVEGEYVFVNYAEIRDFLWLQDHNISVKGKILIAKYGFAFRGEKARLAQQYGALGVLLYPDPEDFNAPNATGYPDTWDLPAGAIPRGNIVNVKGDPLTPLYAAKEGMFRLDIKKVKHLAKIPVTPISYGDAHSLLSVMDGVEVPDPNWQGGLNFTYHVTSKTERRIRMSIDNPRELRKIQNVVATIKGETEPDRLVIIGNHRDAWIYGAGDPSSGTAVLMDVASALGKMLKDGWRPRRTLMLISWDAEEYGLMGSVEWVQEYFAVLSARAVVYINVDIAVSGNYTVRARASPSLIDKFFEVTKKFQDPDFKADNPDRPKNLFTSWKNKERDIKNPDEPSYKPLASGSDYTIFYSTLGVSGIDIRYRYNSNIHPKLSNYPSYHTIYDNFNYYTKFIDPDFRYHALMAKLWLRYATEMADDLVLPFNLTRYSRKILTDAEVFDISFAELLEPQNITMAPVKKAAYELLIASKRFHERLRDVNKNDCHAVRRYNDQMMQFERAFIIPEGFPGRPNMKHVIYSPARKTLFGRKIFPGLTELLYEIEISKKDEWDGIREQISLLVSMLNNAKYVISQFGEI